MEEVTTKGSHDGRTLQRIGESRIIAIIRGDFGSRESEIVGVLCAAGITAVEVTMNSPGAPATIRRLVAEFGAGVAVGAGTILREEEVVLVADAGAEFVVSPNRDVRVIERTKRHGLASLPGCFTPSEIVEAFDAGADAVKLFPASALGAGFVRAVRAPLSDVRLVPTGGVTPETAGEYLAAGAWAIGVGSELVSKDVLAPGGLERLRGRAERFVEAVR